MSDKSEKGTEKGGGPFLSVKLERFFVRNKGPDGPLLMLM